MPTPMNRPSFGFFAAVISVLTFHQGIWAFLHLFGLMPPPYPMRGVPPFGVPLIIDLCFGAAFGGRRSGWSCPHCQESIRCG